MWGVFISTWLELSRLYVLILYCGFSLPWFIPFYYHIFNVSWLVTRESFRNYLSAWLVKGANLQYAPKFSLSSMSHMWQILYWLVKEEICLEYKMGIHRWASIYILSVPNGVWLVSHKKGWHAKYICHCSGIFVEC